MEAYYQMLWQRRGEDSFLEPCFINVNTVTGQNDKSHSSMHNYSGPWERRKWRAEEEREKGPDRCSEVNCSEEMSFHYGLSSSICHLRSLQKRALHFLILSSCPPSNLIIYIFPSHTPVLCLLMWLQPFLKSSSSCSTYYTRLQLLHNKESFKSRAHTGKGQKINFIQEDDFGYKAALITLYSKFQHRSKTLIRQKGGALSKLIQKGF